MRQSSFTEQRTSFFLLILTLVGLFLNTSVKGQSFPAGFSRVLVASGITKPTVMAFAPDSRIFVAQQNGVLRIIKNGKLLTTPFMRLSVASSGERGLIGLALDPNFASNHYLYAYYTLPDASRNRISRFTANGDVVVPGSEVVVLNLSLLSSANNHNGGAMHFGADGKLYVAIGDNAKPANAQNLDTYHGKFLRINSNGSIPSGNPYTIGSSQRKRIWASGLRNPFTFAVQPGTGKIFVNDVGQVTWEEINNATTGGKNFGWPVTEGVSSNSAYSNPVYAYPHGTADGTGCAITGGVFFNPVTTNYPAAYRGRYFFQDLCSKWINVLDLSGTTPTRQSFATNLGDDALGLSVGTDGNLYYLERSTSALYKIIYTTNSAPTIVQQPVSITITAGQQATFKVIATGTAPLHYQWFKNGIVIPGATAATYTIAQTKTIDAGEYLVEVFNEDGAVTSNPATLTVTAFNNPPVAIITAPTENSRYRAGDTIRFSGKATDEEDGTLPASAFTWSVDFYHDTHHHDGPPIADGVKNGSFVIPISGEVATNVWYRILAIVKDSQGLTDTVYRDIHPYLSTITLTTQPAGLKLTLDGQPVTAPSSVSSVEGIQRSIGPIAPQTVNGKTYVFDKWLHGGSANQTVSTPPDNITYTAVYQELFAPVQLEAEAAFRSGIEFSANHTGYTGSGFADYIHPSGDYLEWTVNAPEAGNYYLSFRFALEGSSRKLEIKINDFVIDPAFTFTATNGWNSWENKDLKTNLKAGTNKIRATAISNSGPNIDHLLVSQIASTPPQAFHPTEVAAPALRIYPIPANTYLTVDVPAANGEKYNIHLFNNQGKLVYTAQRESQTADFNTIQLPVANLPKGVYLLKIERERTSVAKVVLIEK